MSVEEAATQKEVSPCRVHDVESRLLQYCLVAAWG